MLETPELELPPDAPELLDPALDGDPEPAPKPELDDDPELDLAPGAWTRPSDEPPPSPT
jgi:hypothetical protein